MSGNVNLSSSIGVNNSASMGEQHADDFHDQLVRSAPPMTVTAAIASGALNNGTNTGSETTAAPTTTSRPSVMEQSSAADAAEAGSPGHSFASFGDFQEKVFSTDSSGPSYAPSSATYAAASNYINSHQDNSSVLPGSSSVAKATTYVSMNSTTAYTVLNHIDGSNTVITTTPFSLNNSSYFRVVTSEFDSGGKITSNQIDYS